MSVGGKTSSHCFNWNRPAQFWQRQTEESRSAGLYTEGRTG